MNASHMQAAMENSLQGAKTVPIGSDEGAPSVEPQVVVRILHKEIFREPAEH